MNTAEVAEMVAKVTISFCNNPGSIQEICYLLYGNAAQLYSYYSTFMVLVKLLPAFSSFQETVSF